MINNMLFYLKNSGSNQRKTKTAIIDCCLSLKTAFTNGKETGLIVCIYIYRTYNNRRQRKDRWPVKHMENRGGSRGGGLEGTGRCVARRGTNRGTHVGTM